MDEQEMKLQEQISQLNEYLAESRSDHWKILKRLDDIEDRYQRHSDMPVTLQRQADAVEALHEKVDALANSLRSVSSRVEDMEKEPGEQWKKMGFEIIKYIVLAAVGAAIGFLMK